MKRYIAFVGYQNWPRGGWKDFKGGWDTLPEATRATIRIQNAGRFCWAHIVDLQSGKIVWQRLT